MKYGFEMHGPYINTHHNTLADDISRLVGKVSDSKLQGHIDTLHEGLVRGSVEEEVLNFWCNSVNGQRGVGE